MITRYILIVSYINFSLKDLVDKHSFFVSTTYGGKINVPMLLKIAEEKCGPLKQSSFREKQCFGFLQFKEQEVCFVLKKSGILSSIGSR
jgi:hypothetical protein